MWQASGTMLPLYKRTVRFLSDPYMRMKKRAMIAVVGALVLLYVLLVGFASDQPPTAIVIHNRPGFQAPPSPPVRSPMPIGEARGDDKDLDAGGGEEMPRPVLRRDDAELADEDDETEPPKPGGAPRAPHREGDDGGKPVVAGGGGAGALDAEALNPKPIAGHDELPSTKSAQMPLLVRLVLPLVAGFCFGFLGSVPIAGPTSAMVLKLGIQGKYQAALTIAVGGAISEATYAGIAFWGFGSFLAGAKFLLPVSKVLGAIMFTVVGIVFLRSDVKPSLDVDAHHAQHKGMRVRPREELLKNILMGLTMSGINPALLATYTGAIASVYGTGMLEFTLFLAFIFGIGVCCGVSTWFFILLSLLKKYKQSLQGPTISIIMRGMGCFLLTLGAFCAKSSFDYFYWGAPEAKP